MLVVLVILAAASCRKAERSSPVSQEPTPRGETPRVITTPGGFEMVLIPAGSFQMGSKDGEEDETPVHQVAIDAFLMDRYEITQSQWARLAAQSEWLASDPSHFKGPDRPVEMVSWDLAALYCNVRSRDEGLQPCYDEETGECNFAADGYRLPTEAEWEYACRAGSDTEYHFGPDPRLLKQYAWYAENASKKTHPVGRKKPNAWGLFDIHGNVAEWCNDRYSEAYYQNSPERSPHGPDDGEQYVLRGGAWNCSAGACRAARRVGENPGFADACFARDAIGFRCVRRAPEVSETTAPEKEQQADAPADNETNANGVGDDRSRGAEKNMQHKADKAAHNAAGKDRPGGVGFVYDNLFLEHKTGPGHPERPQRLTAIVARLEKTGLLDQLVAIQPQPAATDWIARVHTAEYIQRVQKSCEGGVPYLDSPDTPVSKRSYEVGLAAVGGVLAAVDAVMEGRVKSAFCAVRPPGHHALESQAMGFCLFNNVAVAARYVQKKHRLEKVLIIDWDVHHGNGTQAAFYADPTVLYFSVHQYPFYPGTGAKGEQGAGKGLGLVINAPLPPGSGDDEFIEVFQQRLKPAALQFRPDFVLISAGFDAHEHDLLGGMAVTAEGFGRLTRITREIADACCRGRIVSLLEGGYDLDGLAESVEAHLRVLLE